GVSPDATSNDVTLTVNPDPTLGALGITQWTINQIFSTTLTVSGGTGSLSNLTFSGLPTGLTASLSGTTVTIGGTPTAAADFNAISINAQDTSAATASGMFDIHINAAPTFGSLGASAWTVNQAYSSTVTIASGTGPFSNLNFSGLPTGLSAS